MRLFLTIFIFGLLTSSAYSLPPGAQNWETECGQGNAKSCYFHGLRIMNGDHIPQDTRKAMTFAHKACGLKLSDACFFVGELLFKGTKAFGADKKQSIQYFDIACHNLVDKKGCFYHAKAILDTGGDINTALKSADMGCSNKKAPSCSLLASFFLNEKYGQIKDNNKALSYAKKGCALDDSWSCSMAGHLLTGNVSDIKRNGPLALELLDKACQLKDVRACHNAGIQISSGNDLGDDYKRAADYFGTACNNNMEDSCYSAGHLKLLTEQYAEAVPFLTKVCDSGKNPEACRGAGIAIVEIKGPSASRSLYQKGCKLGDHPSCQYIKELDKYEKQQAAYEAYMASKASGAAQVTAALNAQDYNQAMNIASYGLGSREQVARVIMEAEGSGNINRIDPFYFTAVETWLSVDYPQAHNIVYRQVLKNQNSSSAAHNNYSGPPSYSNGPTEPTMDEQFWKNQKDTYKRDLDWANRGGNPAGFKVKGY